MANSLGVPIALIHKGRQFDYGRWCVTIYWLERERANEVHKMYLVVEVNGREAVIIDDMADTCGTLVEAAQILKAHGATRIIAAVIHPILSPPAIDRLLQSPIDVFICTDTVPTDRFKGSEGHMKFITVSISSIFADAIRRIHAGDSLSSIFED